MFSVDGADVGVSGLFVRRPRKHPFFTSSDLCFHFQPRWSLDLLGYVKSLITGGRLLQANNNACLVPAFPMELSCSDHDQCVSKWTEFTRHLEQQLFGHLQETIQEDMVMPFTVANSRDKPLSLPQ